MKELKLADKFLLAGFGNEDEMTSWIEKFNATEDELRPPVFESCCEYKGETDDCKPKAYWVEQMGEMDSGGHWYKSYKTGDQYCKNHFRWSFESALEELGNPKYIIVVNLKQ